MTLRVRAPREDGLPRLCAIIMLVLDWALNRRSVLEDMAICMSKCASKGGKWDWCQLGTRWCQFDPFIHQEE